MDRPTNVHNGLFEIVAGVDFANIAVFALMMTTDTKVELAQLVDLVGLAESRKDACENNAYCDQGPPDITSIPSK